MQANVQREIFERLHAVSATGRLEVEARTTKLSTDRYTDPASLEREYDTLFRQAPIVVAHVDELSEPGSVLRARLGRVPVLVARDRAESGGVRVFLNACRHRGAELLEAEHEGGPAVCRKALTCRYHAWSYGLDGRLIHVPGEDAFAPLAREELGLIELPSAVRHGFVWSCLRGPMALETFLGEAFDDDLRALGLEHHALTATRVHEREANWKLVFDAFAEGYHVNSLHRTSVARYFAGASLVDALGLHVRQVGARKNMAAEWSGFDLRSQTTVFYNLFPNGVLVCHPTWIMHLSLLPLGPRRVRVVHRMLVDRRAPQDAEAVAERARSFAFIDEKIVQAEDLSICESLQRNLDAGVVDEVLVGAREEGMRLFHAHRERWLAGDFEPIAR